VAWPDGNKAANKEMKLSVHVL